MRKGFFCGVLSLVLLCAACGDPTAEESGGTGCTLYFPAVENRADGAALSHESRSLPPDTGGADGLMELLLAGPESPGLRSPFPAGTGLKGVSIREGTAYVDLTEAYGGLSGVDLTLADGCVTLTLCQLEGVEAVYLTVEGRPRPFRDQVLTPADFLTDNLPVEEPQESPSPGEEAPPDPAASGGT